jgi:cysteine-rich repeat protein
MARGHRFVSLVLTLACGCDVASGLTAYEFVPGSAAGTGGAAGAVDISAGGEGGGFGGAASGMPSDGGGGGGGMLEGGNGGGGRMGPACGNGLLEPPEECDDGDTNNGDGCDELCVVTCENGGHKRPLSNHCYWIFGNDKSYNEALVSCHPFDAHLATLTDQAEQSYVIDTVNPGDKFWLGGHDFAQDGTFVWITGEPFPTDLWQSGEPNNGGIGSDQDCVAAYDDDGDLDDENCDDNLDWLCEREPAGK